MTRCAMEAASCHNLKPILIRQELHLEPNLKRLHASFHLTSHIQSQICWMIYKSLASTKQAIQARPLSNHPPRQNAFSCCSCNAVTYCKLHWNISCWNHKTLQACMATQLFHAIQCGRILSVDVGTNIVVAWFKERKAQLTHWPIWAVSWSILTWHAAGKFSLSTKAHKGTEFQPNAIQMLANCHDKDDFAFNWSETWNLQCPLTLSFKRIDGTWKVFVLANVRGLHPNHVFHAFSMP